VRQGGYNLLQTHETSSTTAFPKVSAEAADHGLPGGPINFNSVKVRGRMVVEKLRALPEEGTNWRFCSLRLLTAVFRA
jgi:hypothetical protein